MVQYQIYHAASYLVGGECYYGHGYFGIYHLVSTPQALASSRFATYAAVTAYSYIAKQDKSLARTDSEGQLAWLERLASAIDSRNDTNVNDEAKTSNASTLTDSDHPDVIQEKITQIRQDYRQLRYGRLSTVEINDNGYQKVLKQLKKNVHDLL